MRIPHASLCPWLVLAVLNVAAPLRAQAPDAAAPAAPAPAATDDKDEDQTPATGFT